MDASLKIVIVDDSPLRTAILEDGLRESGYVNVVRIENTRDLLARIYSIDPDVILIALENPSRDVLEQMFQVSRAVKRPIAMFVDQTDAASIQASVDAGVSAYIVDGLKKERIKSILDLCISRFNAFSRLQTELEQTRSALAERKVIDRAKGILMTAKNLSEDAAYALCRPPGHHAYRDLAGGFCFLNNSAIAAAHLRLKHERVAVLDVDVHHGNGTQGIFYERGDVLTVSIHADPNSFYPFVWGYAHERGAGPGLGTNLNIPLPIGTGDDGYLQALWKAQAMIAAFAPAALVVALGLDASEHDPLAGLAVTTDGFRRIGHAIARLKLPTVFVQEGGYLSDSLGVNLTPVLAGLEAAR